MSIPILISVAGLLGLGGIVLIWRGIRGRRVDDHPLCRGCGYDLVGHGEGVAKCPECGADPRKRKRGGRILGNRNPGVIIGHRKRRRVSIGLGVLLVLLAGSGGGVMVWQHQAGFNWNTVKPVWWLRMEGRSEDARTVDGVRAELLRRLEGDDLSEQQVVSITEDYLDNHGDAEEYWSNDLSAFLEKGWDIGLVSDEEFKEYLRNAINLAMELEIRPRVREGMRIPYRYVLRKIRVSKELGAYSRAVPVSIQKSLWRTELDGELITQYRGGTGSYGKLSPTSGGGMGSTEKNKLKPGPHDFALTNHFRIYVGEAARGGFPSRNEEPFIEWTHTSRASFMVVPEDTDAVELRMDPALDKIIRELVTIDLIHQRITIGNRTYSDRTHPHPAMIYIDTPTVDLMLDVYGRDGETEKRLGIRQIRAGRSGSVSPLERSPYDLFPDADRIDIILRANPKLAENTVDITEIWGGEIVFKDVVLREAEEGGASQ